VVAWHFGGEPRLGRGNGAVPRLAPCGRAWGWDGLRGTARLFLDGRNQFRVGYLVSWCPRCFRRVQAGLSEKFGRPAVSGVRDWQRLGRGNFAERAASGCIGLHFGRGAGKIRYAPTYRSPDVTIACQGEGPGEAIIGLCLFSWRWRPTPVRDRGRQRPCRFAVLVPGVDRSACRYGVVCRGGSGSAAFMAAISFRAISAVSGGMSAIVFARFSSRRRALATRPLLNGMPAVSRARPTRLQS